jgi:hypothetical protein
MRLAPPETRYMANSGMNKAFVESQFSFLLLGGMWPLPHVGSPAVQGQRFLVPRWCTVTLGADVPGR